MGLCRSLSSSLGAALLGFVAIGEHSVTDWSGFLLCDWLWLLALPLSLPLVWRERRLLGRSPVLLGLAALSLLELGTVLLVHGLFEERNLAMRSALRLGVLLQLGALALDDRRRAKLLRFALVGGGLALGVAVAGYGYQLLFGELVSGANPFVYVTPNPLVDNWPRLSGTWGASPQHFGEFVLVLLTLFLASRAAQAGAAFAVRAGLVVGGAMLAATLSFAAVGGGVLATTWWLGRQRLRGPAQGALDSSSSLGLARARRWGALFGLSLLVLGGVWVTNVGRPSALTQEEAAGGVDCATIDPEHQVYSVAEQGGRCYPRLIAWPYRAVESTYLHAKRTAFCSFVANPVYGLGEMGYAREVARRFAQESGRTRGMYYAQPHCFYLEAGTRSGLLGAGAVWFLVFTVLAARRRLLRDDTGEALALWCGLLAFFVLGINLDLLSNRGLWLLLGLWVAFEARAAKSKEERQAEAR